MTGTLDRGPMIGERAPDFQLPDINMKIRKLSDYLGKKTILAFFPAAESPTCTAEMCSFRDSITDLQKSGAQIVGISVDGPFANKIFTENRHLNFDLLSDYKRETINKYGVVMHNLGPLEGYDAAKRSIFILDNKGIITYTWLSDDPTIEPNYQEIDAALKKMN